MTGRVFAVDTSSYWRADDAIDVALGIVQSSPDAVIRAVDRVLKTGASDGYIRASVVAHLGGCLAATIEAVHDALPTRSRGAHIPEFEKLSTVYCLGPVRLALIEGNRPIQARALLETELCELLAREGLDLTPAYSTLGVRPLPLRDAALEALVMGETTLAVADSLLASIPDELIHEAAIGSHDGAPDARVFGQRLHRTLFPGRNLLVGIDLFWRDAIVLASRAVADFAQWRSTMTAYQSAFGDDEKLARVVREAISMLETSAIAVGAP
jgi:hypothetical protein